MITFFIKEGEFECGPFTIEQLRLKFVTRETLVWHAALNIWTSAGSIYELRELFDSKFATQNNKVKKMWSGSLLKQPFRKTS